MDIIGYWYTIPVLFCRNNVALPNINQGPSAGGRDGRQLVPYKNAQTSRSYDREPDDPVNYSSAHSEDRLLQLELRVKFAEKANQVLLQEILRTQSDHNNKLRQAQEGLQREDAMRRQLEGAIKLNRGSVTQLVDRLERGDLQRNSDRMALSVLVDQLNTVEHQSHVGQQDAMNKRDVNAAKYVMLIVVREFVNSRAPDFQCLAI